MITFQDFEEAFKSADGRKGFFMRAINEHKSSSTYNWAIEAEAYAKKQNTAILKYQKFVFKETGEKVIDMFTANHKTVSNFFGRFITQQVQYELGNGVTFADEKTKDKLGVNFDTQLQKLAKKALIGGISFGFWNLDHLEIFGADEFIPLLDEETGALRAGIRFWQLDANKPLRVTLYEVDGYTDYIKRKGKSEFELMADKKTYIQLKKTSVADGTEIVNYKNYAGFPIIPLLGNPQAQSELVGIKSQIDAFDLIKSGFANDLDEANFIYWVIENAGGMEDNDLLKFRDRMKTIKAALLDTEGAKAHPETIDVPFQSREVYLKRLEDDLYNDAMALNVSNISAGNVTATAINASYEPLNNKCDEFEYCLIDFISSLLELIGVNDYPIFTRSRIVNQQEETNMILASAQYLDRETIIKKLPFITNDEVEGILDRLTIEEANRFNVVE